MSFSKVAQRPQERQRGAQPRAIQRNVLYRRSLTSPMFNGNDAAFRCIVPSEGDVRTRIGVMNITRKIAIAALAAITIAGSSLTASTAADARPFGGGFRGGGFRGGGFHGGGFQGGGFRGGFRGGRFGIGAGVVTDLAIGGLGYGYGYPYYGGNYAYDDYGYGGCYLQRRLFVDQFGRRFVRPVRVCS